ncbi:hypothetical protein RDWZM_002854 [Blomia tropicalis]|uniref:Uncharacterized protein n=1 Tax=Blomia tropicalis TaxID=40697 RepID=A0A9Q0MEH4_BLOTA|nr:hypothetical protein RDWZM_002854 [Blomia tropicalis]
MENNPGTPDQTNKKETPTKMANHSPKVVGSKLVFIKAKLESNLAPSVRSAGSNSIKRIIKKRKEHSPVGKEIKKDANDEKRRKPLKEKYKRNVEIGKIKDLNVDNTKAKQEEVLEKSINKKMVLKAEEQKEILKEENRKSNPIKLIEKNENLKDKVVINVNQLNQKSDLKMKQEKIDVQEPLMIKLDEEKIVIKIDQPKSIIVPIEAIEQLKAEKEDKKIKEIEIIKAEISKSKQSKLKLDVTKSLKNESTAKTSGQVINPVVLDQIKQAIEIVMSNDPTIDSEKKTENVKSIIKPNQNQSKSKEQMANIMNQIKKSIERYIKEAFVNTIPNEFVKNLSKPKEKVKHKEPFAVIVDQTKRVIEIALTNESSGIIVLPNNSKVSKSELPKDIVKSFKPVEIVKESVKEFRNDTIIKEQVKESLEGSIKKSIDKTIEETVKKSNKELVKELIKQHPIYESIKHIEKDLVVKDSEKAKNKDLVKKIVKQFEKKFTKDQIKATVKQTKKEPGKPVEKQPLKDKVKTKDKDLAKELIEQSETEQPLKEPIKDQLLKKSNEETLKETVKELPIKEQKLITKDYNFPKTTNVQIVKWDEKDEKRLIDANEALVVIVNEDQQEMQIAISKKMRDNPVNTTIKNEIKRIDNFDMNKNEQQTKKTRMEKKEVVDIIIKKEQPTFLEFTRSNDSEDDDANQMAPIKEMVKTKEQKQIVHEIETKLKYNVLKETKKDTIKVGNELIRSDELDDIKQYPIKLEKDETINKQMNLQPSIKKCQNEEIKFFKFTKPKPIVDFKVKQVVEVVRSTDSDESIRSTTKMEPKFEISKHKIKLENKVVEGEPMEIRVKQPKRLIIYIDNDEVNEPVIIQRSSPKNFNINKFNDEKIIIVKEEQKNEKIVTNDTKIGIVKSNNIEQKIELKQPSTKLTIKSLQTDKLEMQKAEPILTKETKSISIVLDDPNKKIAIKSFHELDDKQKEKFESIDLKQEMLNSQTPQIMELSKEAKFDFENNLKLFKQIQDLEEKKTDNTEIILLKVKDLIKFLDGKPFPELGGIETLQKIKLSVSNEKINAIEKGPSIVERNQSKKFSFQDLSLVDQPKKSLHPSPFHEDRICPYTEPIKAVQRQPSDPTQSLYLALTPHINKDLEKRIQAYATQKNETLNVVEEKKLETINDQQKIATKIDSKQNQVKKAHPQRRQIKMTKIGVPVSLAIVCVNFFKKMNAKELNKKRSNNG